MLTRQVRPLTTTLLNGQGLASPKYIEFFDNLKYKATFNKVNSHRQKGMHDSLCALQSAALHRCHHEKNRNDIHTRTEQCTVCAVVKLNTVLLNIHTDQGI